MLRSLCHTCILLVLALSAIAQDLHFTNYTLSPQTLNPARVGDFEGTYKIGGIYRDQFSQFFSSGTKSIGGFLEYNLPFNVGNRAWLAASASLDHDKAGDLGFRNTRTGLNVAYHLFTSTKKRNILSIGIQGISVKRGIETTGVISAESLQSKAFTEASLLNSYNKSQLDAGAGIQYEMEINRQTSTKIGIGILHLMHSKIKLASGNSDYIPFRINIHGELTIRTNEKFSFTPRAYYANSENASELLVQFLTDINLQDNILRLGLGSRFGDALQFLIGFQLKGWNVYGGFDMTTSSAKAYNDSFGGFEIGMYKIISINPKVKLNPVFLCPRL